LTLRKVDAVMHLVDDIYEAAEFYEKVLGLKRGWTDDENNMVGMLLPGNDTEIVLHMNKYLPNPNVSFQVENVLDFVAKYKAKGYKVLEEPFDIRCGQVCHPSRPLREWGGDNGHHKVRRKASVRCLIHEK
jgi:predicted enzyme related to lactoylglutathione lyase